MQALCALDALQARMQTREDSADRYNKNFLDTYLQLTLDKISHSLSL